MNLLRKITLVAAVLLGLGLAVHLARQYVNGSRSAKLVDPGPLAGESQAGPSAAEDDELTERFARFARKALRLKAAAAPEDRIPIGASKLGGTPDVPVGFAWPEWRGKPLGFVAQIDLAEVAVHLADSPLPQTGLLAFFYEPSQEAWGFDPRDAGAWRVVWFDGGSLRRATVPSGVPQDARYKACRLLPAPRLSYPEPDSLASRLAGIPDADKELYAGFLRLRREADPTGHQLLGHADPVQNEMELECQLVTNGLFTGDRSGWHDPRRKELEPGAADWILLLQIDSDDAAGMMWGDVGCLYYWIRKQDLAARRFDKVWMIFQCA